MHDDWRGTADDLADALDGLLDFPGVRQTAGEFTVYHAAKALERYREALDA